MEKFLLFSTGDGATDPQNLTNKEIAMYKASDLISIRPSSARTIDLYFKTDQGTDTVTLGIKGSTHGRIMRAISIAIVTVTNNNQVISVADLDNYRTIDADIWSVSIKHQYIDVMTVNSTTKEEVARNSIVPIRTMSICNTNDSTDVALDIWLTDITGTSLRDTSINAHEAEVASNNSVTLNVDNTVPTNDLVLNERIYNSGGKFFGVATAWADASPDTITFGDGLENAIANNDDLYRGKRTILLNDLEVPAKATLVLNTDEINYNPANYALFIQASAATLDIITRY